MLKMEQMGRTELGQLHLTPTMRTETGGRPTSPRGHVPTTPTAGGTTPPRATGTQGRATKVNIMDRIKEVSKMTSMTGHGSKLNSPTRIRRGRRAASSTHERTPIGAQEATEQLGSRRPPPISRASRAKRSSPWWLASWRSQPLVWR